MVKTDISSNKLLVLHLGQAIVSFAVMMFGEIRDYLEEMAAAGVRPENNAGKYFQYQDFRMVSKDYQDTLIVSEFICLFLAELDLCMFEFRYPEAVRSQVHAVLVRSLANEAGMEDGHLVDILSARIQSYSLRLVKTSDSLPDEDLADELMLYIMRSLGARRIHKTGMIYPVFHDISCLKYAYLKHGYAFHAGLRHYLYRLLKTIDELGIIEDELFCDLFHEAVCVGRQTLVAE